MPVVLHNRITLPETNVAPESLGLEDVASFWEGLLAGAMLVLGRVCSMFLSLLSERSFFRLACIFFAGGRGLTY